MRHVDDSRPLTAQHDAIKDCMGGLILPDIDLSIPNTRIIDSGTGDGHWLRDLAASLPTDHQCTLIGTDIAAARFPQGSQPRGITLLPQSITKPWPEDWQNSFDLVHQRLVLGGCGTFPHKEAVNNLVGLVKPGGQIQLIEPEQVCGVDDGAAMREFIELVVWVFVSMGGNVCYQAHLRQWLHEAGITELQERGVPLFLGAKNPDKELAHRTALSTARAMEPLIALAKASTKPSPLSAERLETLVQRLYEELLEQGGYYPLRVVWGRKPLV